MLTHLPRPQIHTHYCPDCRSTRTCDRNHEFVWDGPILRCDNHFAERILAAVRETMPPRWMAR